MGTLFIENIDYFLYQIFVQQIANTLQQQQEKNPSIYLLS